MKKKGVVSIFILLGIFVILVGLLFYYVEREQEEVVIPPAPTDFQQYHTFIENCLELKAKESVDMIAKSGGYNEVKSHFIEGIFFSYPYYFDQGKTFTPSKQEIEKELAGLYAERGALCHDSLKEIIPTGLETELGEISTESTITSEGIVLKMMFPLAFITEKREETKKEYLFEMPAQVEQLHTAVEDFVNQQQETPEGLCWTCLASIAEKYDLKVDASIVKEDIVIFSFHQNETMFPLTWIFAGVY